MGVVRNTSVLAIGAANNDQLTVDAVPLDIRIVEEDGVLTLAAVATLADVLISLLVNGQRVTADAAPVVKATGPILPEDILAQVPVLEGDIIAMTTRNTNAAANTLFYYLDVP